MAKDTITAKFNINAGFETVQAIRRALAGDEAQAEVAGLLGEMLQSYLARQVNGKVVIETALKVSREARTKAGPQAPIPKVEKGVLSWYDPDADKTNIVGKVGGRAWHRWLADEYNRSFSYVSKHQTAFTAMRRKDGIWYAHKRLNGKLRRKYLGRADKLTIAKMDQVAFDLGQREFTV